MQRQADQLVAAAARDNAAWCAAMCTTHGIASSVRDGLWAAHAAGFHAVGDLRVWVR